MTPLDIAHAAMERDETDEASRLRFFDCLADGEFFLLLEEEPEGNDLKPRLFPLEEGPVILIFDLEERMAEFSGGVAPYAALPGRVIAQMLAGQGIGLGVNLGVAPSQMILPPEAMDWLAGLLEGAPEEAEDVPERFEIPRRLPAALVQALEAKLARMAGLAAFALLMGVTYRGGRRGHMLAIVGAAEAAREALAHAVREAVVFSGLEAGVLDVTFLTGEEEILARMVQVARRFDIPAPEVRERAAPAAPGSDPERPPKLR